MNGVKGKPYVEEFDLLHFVIPQRHTDNVVADYGLLLLSLFATSHTDTDNIHTMVIP